MLSYSTNYGVISKDQNAGRDWLLELAHDSGTYYFSSTDKTITNRYFGIVLDWGYISEKINISKSSASTADVQITLQNNYNNATGFLSDELFGSTQYFLNHNATIREWAPGCSLSDCPVMYVGRIKDITHDKATVTINLEKRQPWDYIKIPVLKTTAGNYFPVTYGDYSGNTSTVASPQILGDVGLFPVPVDVIKNDKIYCLLPDKATGTYHLHFYEKNLDRFCPIDPNDDTVISYQEQYAITCPANLYRGAKFYPPAVADGNDFLDETYPATNAIDGNDATYAYDTGDVTVEFGGSTSVSLHHHLMVDMPEIEGKFSYLGLRIKWALAGNATGSGGLGDLYFLGQLYETSYTGAIIPGAGIGTGYSEDPQTDSADQTIDLTAAYISGAYSKGVIDIDFLINASFDGSGTPGASYTWSAYCKIYSIDVIYNIATDMTNEPQSSSILTNSLKYLYSGAEALDASYTGAAAGVVTFPHDIFRDALNRFCGWDATGIDYVEVNGVDWSASDIDTDRSWSFGCKITERTLLAKTLNQMQFEGGFIWIFENASSAIEARVIYVKNGTDQTYDSGDVQMTYNGDDLNGITIGHTPFSSVVTKRIYNYNRNPATGEYRSSRTKTNSNRGNWNFATEENTQELDLDFLILDADVAKLQTYYDNIDGEPKLVVSFDTAFALHRKTQVGDIIQFTSMPYDPFGASWTDKYFMVVGTDITLKSIKITVQEVS